MLNESSQPEERRQRPRERSIADGAIRDAAKDWAPASTCDASSAPQAREIHRLHRLGRAGPTKRLELSKSER
eukprot:4823061-Pyramimonas_sp.AAC.1